MRHLARRKIGKVALRQRLQSEPRAAGANGHHRALAGALDHHLRALGQLAHNLINHVRGNGSAACRTNLRSNCLRHLKIEISRFESESRIFCSDENIPEDRNCIAPLYDTMNMSKRFQ